ncbi:nucleotidyltransferase domain-containing protein [Priestia megaterium]|uniref:nucleotidyltransferase domain-containing protein n=1 Tax=Priestia megaterium TaxID=1404 RepID=UPI003D0512DE
MANLQEYFRKFHNSIKLDYDDNKELRDKRDELIEFLKDNMPEESCSFKTFNQGSYAMFTGVKALDGGDYDIDIALLFNLSKEDYSNPITVKKWVYDSFCKEYDDVEMKKPCVTVKFESEGENERDYHVDLAVFSSENQDGQTYLARGQLHSAPENRCWEHSDPEKLVSDIKGFPSDSQDREQFRRIVRFMKRWKDIKFKGQVNRPSGIGLTVAGLTHFQAQYTQDFFTNTRKYSDLDALEIFVQSMLNSFIPVLNSEGEWEDRLRVCLPTPPNNDIYSKMTGNQMMGFKDKLQCLLNKVQEAKLETDPVIACELMVEEFGDDFPIPTVSNTAQKRGPSIIIDNSSA